jgi:hypothetical protein
MAILDKIVLFINITSLSKVQLQSASSFTRHIERTSASDGAAIQQELVIVCRSADSVIIFCR